MSNKNLNGLELPFGIKSPNKMYSPDTYAGPYETLQDALDTIIEAIRIPGRKFAVYNNERSDTIEYKFIFKEGAWDVVEVNKNSIGLWITNPSSTDIVELYIRRNTKFMRNDSIMINPTDFYITYNGQTHQLEDSASFTHNGAGEYNFQIAINDFLVQTIPFFESHDNKLYNYNTLDVYTYEVDGFYELMSVTQCAGFFSIDLNKLMVDQREEIKITTFEGIEVYNYVFTKTNDGLITNFYSDGFGDPDYTEYQDSYAYFMNKHGERMFPNVEYKIDTLK